MPIVSECKGQLINFQGFPLLIQIIRTNFALQISYLSKINFFFSLSSAGGLIKMFLVCKI